MILGDVEAGNSEWFLSGSAIGFEVARSILRGAPVVPAVDGVVSNGGGMIVIEGLIEPEHDAFPVGTDGCRKVRGLPGGADAVEPLNLLPGAAPQIEPAGVKKPVSRVDPSDQ